MRDPLEKEKFMEGNRQKWAAIFLFSGAVVLFVNIWIGLQFDPDPYMQFLLGVGSLFILGASGDSLMKTYSAKKIKEAEVMEETKRITPQQDVSIPEDNVVSEYDARYSDDKSYAPKKWIDTYE
jgi:hypothetical protein